MFAPAFKSAVIVSVVAFLAVVGGVPTSSNSQCDNGELKCCETLIDPTTAGEQELGGLSGLGLQNLEGNAGLVCIPINVLGLGNAANCNQQAACCNNVSQNGLFNFGCSPVNFDL